MTICGGLKGVKSDSPKYTLIRYIANCGWQIEHSSKENIKVPFHTERRKVVQSQGPEMGMEMEHFLSCANSIRIGINAYGSNFVSGSVSRGPNLCLSVAVEATGCWHIIFGEIESLLRILLQESVTVFSHSGGKCETFLDFPTFIAKRVFASKLRTFSSDVSTSNSKFSLPFLLVQWRIGSNYRRICDFAKGKIF